MIARSVPRCALLAVLPGVLLLVVWQTHVVLTQFHDPLGLPFDRSLWVTSCLLKMASLISTPILLSAVYKSIAGSRHSAVLAFAMWTMIGAVLVSTAAVTRQTWAPILTNDAVKYYSLHDDHGSRNPRVIDPAIHAELGTHWQQWRTEWLSGRIVRCEIAVVGGVALINALVGFSLGRRPILGPVIGYVLTFGILILYCSAGWHLSDYDEFHGDMFPSALLVDHLIFFVAVDPYTTISSIVHASFAATSLGILTICDRMLPSERLSTAEIHFEACSRGAE